MSFHALLLMVTATFVFVMTPGPGIFALVSRALSRGPVAAIVLTLGLICADFVYLSLALAGLAFVAQRFHTVFVVVKGVGALYLIYLGVKAWRAAPRAMTRVEERPRGLWRDFAAGFATSGSNPKVILFYLGVLPALVEMTHMNWAHYVLIVSVVTTTLFAGCLVYVALCARMRRLFASTGAVRRLNRVAGVILVGAGIGVAAS